ncbi:MAG: T9SS type A sorting domain-containing protein [Bacteroidetes bacterium]|nr:T9SS type A sorting domain-containing protein [Bacteroidota bacterium]
MKKIIITSTILILYYIAFPQTPSTPPTGISVSLDPVCAGQATLLTVVGGSLGTGAQWQWYIGSCGGMLAGSGSTATVTLPSTTTFYVRAEGTVNTTTCASVTISVNSISIAAASVSAAPNPVNSGNSTTLSVSGGTLGTGAQWQWYSGSCGGTWVGSGNTITLSPLGTTTYYVRAEGACNTTSCVSVTVTVNPVSINEMLSKNDQTLLFNTGTGEFIIDMEITGQSYFEIKLLTVTGRIIYEETLNNYTGKYQKTVDMRSHAKGIYIIQVKSEKGAINRKMILQ